MLEDLEIDAVIACLPWNVTETWLPDLLATPKPVLLEKPIALSSSVLSQAIRQNKNTLQNKYAGFNRRFYRTVQTLKDRVNQGGVTSVEVTISETVEALAKTYGKQIVEHLLAYSSSHILDTAFHIFGPLKPIRIYGHNDTDNAPKFASFSGLLETGQGAPVFLTVLADNPAPVGIRIFFDDQTTWHLSPMERLIAYRGYDRTEPNTDSKIRRYTPKPFLEIDEDVEFKPGFLEQMRAFTEGSGRPISASPEESLELLSFIETVQSMAAGEERVPASPVGSSQGGDNTGD
jgi:predicted dehydrogenase